MPTPNAFSLSSLVRGPAIFGALMVWPTAFADDGWMGNGGTPSLMNSKHPSVRMADEVVKIHIGKDTTIVDCTFHFVNDGPATSVRMGFPDEDTSREDGDHTVFKKYESWVDGKSVRCTFGGSAESGFWQMKTVRFAANQRHTVRDRYTVRTGAGYQGGKSYLHYAKYILHTGNTWKGSIGRVEVAIDFDEGFFQPAKLMLWKDVDKTIHPEDKYMDEARADVIDRTFNKNKRTVFWYGPTKPTLKNGVVRFVTTNLKPKKDDDIELMFAPFKPN